MLSFRPLVSRARARLRGFPGIVDDAAVTEELCPAGMQEIAPAIALPSEWERVRAVDEFSTWEIQQERISGRQLPTLATVAYRLDDAMLHDGAVLTARNALVLRAQKRRPAIRAVDVELDEAALASDSVIEGFFGHWIRDALALEQLAADRGLPALAPQRPLWLHEPGYRALLAGSGPVMAPAAHVKSLWIVDDRGLGTHRQARAQALRARIRGAVAGKGVRGVFLRRGSSGKARALVNEDAIADYLTGQGFAVIAPEQCEAKDIVATLADADIVVGVEGSAINHANLAMPAGAAILVIQPPHRFNAIGRPVAALYGQRYAYVVGEPVGKGSFSLEIDRLRRTIDLIDETG